MCVRWGKSTRYFVCIFKVLCWYWQVMNLFCCWNSFYRSSNVIFEKESKEHNSRIQKCQPTCACQAISYCQRGKLFSNETKTQFSWIHSLWCGKMLLLRRMKNTSKQGIVIRSFLVRVRSRWNLFQELVVKIFFLNKTRLDGLILLKLVTINRNA